MGLQHLLALLPLVAPIVQAQLTTDIITTDATTDNTTNATATNENEIVSAPIYTPEECNNWISTMKSSDVDSSGGLSSSEYFEFFSGIEDPPYIAEYFQQYSNFGDLPWVFRVVHKSLACHCQTLGMGEECCEGDNAEVLLLGLEESGNPSTNVEEQYKDVFCQQIAYVLTKSIDSPAPTAAPSLSPSKSPTAGPTQLPSLAPSPNPTISPVAGASDQPSVSPSLGPTIALEQEMVAVVEVEPLGVENPVEEDDDDGMGTGAIIGIILALIAVVLAIIALVAYRRKLEEERLRKLAGVHAPEADLEAPPPAMEEKGPEPEPEPAAEPEQAPEPDEDDESSAPSVWSESDEDDDTMGELHDENDVNENKPSAGSSLAAMGAASTVAASLMSSPTISPKGLEDSPEGGVPIGEIEVYVPKNNRV